MELGGESMTESFPSWVQFIESGWVHAKYFYERALIVIGENSQNYYRFYEGEGFESLDEFKARDPVNIFYDNQAEEFILCKREINHIDIQKALWNSESELRARVLRYELDYELATLYDALQQNDQNQVEESKRKLKKLRSEALLLEL